MLEAGRQRSSCGEFLLNCNYVQVRGTEGVGEGGSVTISSSHSIEQNDDISVNIKINHPGHRSPVQWETIFAIDALCTTTAS